MFTKPLTALVLGLAIIAALPADAFAWGCSRSFSGSGRYGGSFSHTGSTSGGWGDFSHSGSTSYTNRYGQTYSGSHSGSGTYGYGGASYHGSYSNSSGGSGSYSGSAYHSGYYGGPSYYGYHSVSYNNDCCCCSSGGAFAAGMVTGAVTTAAIASATKPASTTYVYPSSGVYYPSGGTTVNVINNSGESMPGADAIGAQSTQLPPGAQVMNVNGQQYFQSGPNWWQMRTGPAGTVCVVVPAP